MRCLAASCPSSATAAAAVAELARTHTDDPTAAAPTQRGLPMDLVGGCGAVLAVCEHGSSFGWQAFTCAASFSRTLTKGRYYLCPA